MGHGEAMDILSNLALGFGVAISAEALFFCFVGVTIGTFVGVLPGIGAVAAISMALPLTFYMDPTIGLIMLAGIFYGAQYGSSTAAILLNIPGTATAAVTCLDGYPMARQGRAGVALFVTTITSFLGGSFAILLLMSFAPILAKFAIGFGSVEYFAIMVLGLVAASTIGIGSPVKGLTMVVFGVILGLVGTDVSTGVERYTFDFFHLHDGISLVALAMGIFGISEVLASIGQNVPSMPKKLGLSNMLPTRDDVRRCGLPTVRGTLIGSAVGILPGSGPSIATFMSYAVEKRISKEPERFGRGAVEGVASPEASNNAAVQAAFIPTLSLGLPGDAVMAILLGAMLMHGIVPGPQFIGQNPEMFWGLIVSFWIGNVLLLILNLPLIGIWVRLLSIPYRILYPAMLFFICVGVYSVKNSMFDVYVAIVFGVVGYFMLLLRYPAAPLLLGFILGPLIEEHFRRAMLIGRGDFTVFVQSTISAVFLGVAALLLTASAVRVYRMRARS